MMAFPQTPLDLAVELYVNAAWTDITPDVYRRDGIRISRGRPNESGQTPPQSCQLTLDNSSRNYSLRNPTGAYYGTLGRNTPLRVGIRTEKDSFTRTSASGWGSADTGGAWSTASSGGTISATDYSIASGVGRHSVPAANAARLTYLASALYHDVDVSVSFSLPFSNITGAEVAAALLVGGLSTAAYYWAKITIDASEVIRVGIYYADGTQLAAPVIVPITFTGQTLRTRFQLDGHTLRVKVWPASGGEPYAWNAEVTGQPLSTYQINRAAGWVGIRSDVATSNTNTKPVVFSYDAFEVRSNRFAGEVSAWPTKWDPSGRDVYSQITASGITRRLKQGEAPAPSAFRRAFTSLAVPPLVYWPCEDGRDATEMASAIGGAPMGIYNARPNMASNSDFPCSMPIPVVNNSGWGHPWNVVGAANTGVLQTTFLLSVPTGGETADSAFIQVHGSGTAPFWNIAYSTVGAGGFTVKAYDGGGTLIYTGTGGSDFNLKGRPVWVSFELVQNGGNIDWALVTIDAKTLAGGSISGTFAASTVGSLLGVMVSRDANVGSSAIGHVMSRNYYTSLFVLTTYLASFAGETARARIQRLCTENGVPFGYLYDGKTSSTLVGAQGQEPVTTLISEAADADKGVLFESRSFTNVQYRTRSTNYNQAVALGLDYAAGHLVPPFDPVEDDQTLTNDVNVTRKGGSSLRTERTTGPLAVTDAFSTAQGVGRYSTSVTQSLYRDLQLPDAAGWMLHLGTIDEARYPAFTVKLEKFAGVSPQLYLDALGVDVGGRITITNPKAGFDPNSIDQLVQGYREDLNTFEHQVTFTCTPGSPYRVLELDTAAYAAVDSGTSTLVSGVSSSATSLSVATTNKLDLWRTGAVSFSITIAGEAMTVTNITGATSPQTFTVTRSTNGVVKAQLAAAQVHLTRPATLAY